MNGKRNWLFGVLIASAVGIGIVGFGWSTQDIVTEDLAGVALVTDAEGKTYVIGADGSNNIYLLLAEENKPFSMVQVFKSTEQLIEFLVANNYQIGDKTVTLNPKK